MRRELCGVALIRITLREVLYMKKVWRVFIIIVLAVSVGIDIYFVKTVIHNVIHDLNQDNYEVLQDWKPMVEFMPEQEQFPEATTFTAKHHGGLFPRDYYMRKVSGDANYQVALDIASSYSYLTQPATDYKGDIVIPTVAFDVGSYHFRVVAASDPLAYPKRFGMVAQSETEKTILFIWINDPDLGVIEDMEQFVKKELKLQL